MNVLVINQYASSEMYPTGAGERHYYIASKLSKYNIQYTILTSRSNHLLKERPPLAHVEHISSESKIHWLSRYTYSANSGFGRVWSWIDFLFCVLRFKLEKSPDVVVLSSMSIVPIFAAIYIARRNKARLILEIRDIWPLTFIELGGYSKIHPVVLFLRFCERIAYRYSDRITSVLPGFSSYLKTINENYESEWIPNGIDTDVDLPIIETRAKKADSKIDIVYAGAIGTANNLEVILATIIKLENEHFHLHVYGDGPLLAEFREKYNSSMITFYGKISKSDVVKTISQFDLAIIAWHSSKVYDYGVSANKYNDYMLAKLPILSASGLSNDPVYFAKCGFVVDADSESILRCLTEIRTLSFERLKRLGESGYDYLISNQSYNVLSEKWRKLLETA